MASKKYKQVPNVPDSLSEIGKDYWAIYCHTLLDRDDLKKEYLSSIETLCYLEQQKLELQQEINDHGLFNVYNKDKKGEDVIVQSNGTQKMLFNTIKEIEKLKKSLHLHPKKPSKSDKKKKNPLLQNGKDI